jgi:hypothetical protein
MKNTYSLDLLAGVFHLRSCGYSLEKFYVEFQSHKGPAYSFRCATNLRHAVSISLSSMCKMVIGER